MNTHTHTYFAVSPKRRLYRCIRQRCTHSIAAILLAGREAECPQCGQHFFVTKEHLRRRKIACIGCGLKPKSITSLPVPVEPPTPPQEFTKPEKRSIARILQRKRKAGPLPTNARAKAEAQVKSWRSIPPVNDF